MTIWVLTVEGWDFEDILGLFSTKEKAKKAKEKIDMYDQSILHIYSFEVDEE